MNVTLHNDSEYRIDELFDQLDSTLTLCDRNHVRHRIDGLLLKLNELDAQDLKDTSLSRVALVKRAKEVMTLNVRKPLTITQIARECSTSPSMLKQTFRAVMGMPIYQWYRAYRVGIAQGFLESTDLPIAQIAAAVGYSNPSKFSKAFREEVGKSPREWREIHGI